MLMWNDQIDVFSQVNIPTDVIIEYWRPDLITKEKGVYQALLDKGYETVNSHYLYTYIDGPDQMTEKKISVWDTHTEYLGKKGLLFSVVYLF